MSCLLIFFKIFFVIPNLHLRTLIGVGERRDGLYYFHDFPRIGASNIDGSLLLICGINVLAILHIK